MQFVIIGYKTGGDNDGEQAVWGAYVDEENAEEDAAGVPATEWEVQVLPLRLTSEVPR